MRLLLRLQRSAESVPGHRRKLIATRLLAALLAMLAMLVMLQLLPVASPLQLLPVVRTDQPSSFARQRRSRLLSMAKNLHVVEKAKLEDLVALPVVWVVVLALVMWVIL